MTAQQLTTNIKGAVRIKILALKHIMESNQANRDVAAIGWGFVIIISLTHPGKEWMDENRNSKEYNDGVNLFIQFAMNNYADPSFCPCKKCRNVNELKSLKDIRYHLFLNGIDQPYTTWCFYGEVNNEIDNTDIEDLGISSSIPLNDAGQTRMFDLVIDALGRAPLEGLNDYTDNVRSNTFDMIRTCLDELEEDCQDVRFAQKMNPLRDEVAAKCVQGNNETEQTKVRLMRANVEKQNPSAKDVDDLLIRRFLHSRKLDIEKASTHFLKFLEWRARFFPNGSISESEMPSELGQDKVFLSGWDKTRRPISVVLGGKHVPAKGT
ncbi:hypothetical protein GIB67_028271 [Kingdonia uniflora]|uniref:Transposase-associated domain-containing protein n=1 Tax=Kingdonia uniflora TaxID=39325 RepID=A0A7J7KZ92_9MAGN|nr:hypothetical protein GIB67_028271 [Kingdonia uniflora]